MATLASQPFAATPSQSPKPAAHALYPHAPLAHRGAATLRGTHAALHAPQCTVLVRVSVSHPLLGSASQSAKPGAHRASRHTPATQLADALAKAHRRSHAPQCPRSVRVSTHSGPQRVAPPVQPAEHARATWSHTGRAASQRSPQRPQFVVVPRAVSQPLAGSASQSAKLGRHAPIAHRPSAHCAVALAKAHTASQRPQ